MEIARAKSQYAVELVDVSKRHGFSQVKFGVTPKVNALATILLVASVAILVTSFYTLTRRGRS